VRQLTELKIEQTNQRRLLTKLDALTSKLLRAAIGRIRRLKAEHAGMIQADPVCIALDQASARSLSRVKPGGQARVSPIVWWTAAWPRY